MVYENGKRVSDVETITVETSDLDKQTIEIIENIETNPASPDQLYLDDNLDVEFGNYVDFDQFTEEQEQKFMKEVRQMNKLFSTSKIGEGKLNKILKKKIWNTAIGQDLFPLVQQYQENPTAERRQKLANQIKAATNAVIARSKLKNTLGDRVLKNLIDSYSVGVEKNQNKENMILKHFTLSNKIDRESALNKVPDLYEQFNENGELPTSVIEALGLTEDDMPLLSTLYSAETAFRAALAKVIRTPNAQEVIWDKTNILDFAKDIAPADLEQLTAADLNTYFDSNLITAMFYGAMTNLVSGSGGVTNSNRDIKQQRCGCH